MTTVFPPRETLGMTTLDLGYVADDDLEEERDIMKWPRLRRRSKPSRSMPTNATVAGPARYICSAFHATPKYSSINPARSRIQIIRYPLKDIWLPVLCGRIHSGRMHGPGQVHHRRQGIRRVRLLPRLLSVQGDVQGARFRPARSSATCARTSRTGKAPVRRVVPQRRPDLRGAGRGSRRRAKSRRAWRSGWNRWSTNTAWRRCWKRSPESRSPKRTRAGEANERGYGEQWKR